MKARPFLAVATLGRDAHPAVLVGRPGQVELLEDLGEGLDGAFGDVQPGGDGPVGVPSAISPRTPRSRSLRTARGSCRRRRPTRRETMLGVDRRLAIHDPARASTTMAMPITRFSVSSWSLWQEAS
jgi:hypothetical protein